MTTESPTTLPQQTRHHPDPAAIELRGITKRYGRTTAVDNLDLRVPQGQILALLGPNGAGKSTTTEMILGLTKPDTGRVTVLGTTPFDASGQGRVGAMLQNGNLLDGVSVRTMLRMLAALQPSPVPLAELVERTQIGDVMGTPTTKLSGGERQRVRTAIALLPNPDLLLLDEPTVGMDVEARRRFWSQMRDLSRQGRTIMFTTHHLEEADEFAQRVVVLAAGRVVADGTGAEIKQRGGGRTVRFRADAAHEWSQLPGVDAVEVSDGQVLLRSRDSDATLRHLIETRLPVHDIEISAARLEDAFVELTH